MAAAGRRISAARNSSNSADPDGGDGGRGGHIILRGDSQYWTLIHLKYQRHQFAEDGEGGSGAPLLG